MQEDNDDQFLLVDSETQSFEQGEEDIANAIAHEDGDGKEPMTTSKISLDDIDIDALRAGIISITTYRHDGVPLGMEFEEEEEDIDGNEVEPRIVLSSITHDDNEDFFCFPSNAPIQVGDFLEKINDETVSSWNIEDVLDLLEEPGLLTLTFATPKGNPSLVQAFVVKPSAESSLGIIINQQVSSDNGGEIFVQGVVNEEMTNYDRQSLPPLLQHAALKPNDILLSINGTILQDNESCKDPNQVAQMLRDAPYDVTMVAIRPPTWQQKFAKGLRKSAVGAAGGTMVGVGLVFIPTLPPPFGELLIVGGVSLLGTEFEAPKKVMIQARDSLKDAVGPEESFEETKAGKEQDDFVLVSDDDVSTDEAAMKMKDSYMYKTDTTKGSTNSKKNMSSRFKKFGRRFVLPILDQVVGDNPPSSVQK